MSWLTDPAQGILAGALDGLSRREAAIGANLANVDTPGYRPESFDFESALRTQLEASPLAALLVADTGVGPGAAVMPSPANLRGPSVGPSAATALRTSDLRHLQGGVFGAATGTAVTSFDASMRNDANTVDVDSEVTALATTQLKYSAVARLLSGKLGMLRDVAGDHG